MEAAIAARLTQRLAEFGPELARASAALAELDCLLSLAIAARDLNLCRPQARGVAWLSAEGASAGCAGLLLGGAKDSEEPLRGFAPAALPARGPAAARLTTAAPSPRPLAADAHQRAADRGRASPVDRAGARISLEQGGRASADAPRRQLPCLPGAAAAAPCASSCASQSLPLGAVADCQRLNFPAPAGGAIHPQRHPHGRQRGARAGAAAGTASRVAGRRQRQLPLARRLPNIGRPQRRLPISLWSGLRPPSSDLEEQIVCQSTADRDGAQPIRQELLRQAGGRGGEAGPWPCRRTLTALAAGAPPGRCSAPLLPHGSCCALTSLPSSLSNQASLPLA